MALSIVVCADFDTAKLRSVYTAINGRSTLKQSIQDGGNSEGVMAKRSIRVC